MDIHFKVDIKNLGVMFGNLNVLKGLNLEVNESEFLVLLGSSGCGKSTLLNAIAGLVDAKEGEIWIGNQNVTWREPKDRGIAMVFQSYALYPRMSVRENMTFGSRVAGLPSQEIETRLKEAARMLKLEALLDRKPSDLSGGQRQRVAIGRALIRQAGVYLFDEPLSNLDAQLRAELRVEIKRLHQKLSATMIYVTHDQVEAMTLADRVAVMQGGVIQQLDTPEAIYRRPANLFVASFVGSPAMNLIAGTLEFTEGARVFCAEGLEVPLDGYDFRARVPPRKVTLGVRPEHILVGEEADARGILVPVEMLDKMGADSYAWCAHRPGINFRVRLKGDCDVRPQSTLKVSFPAKAVSLFDTDTGMRL
jgi:multiple sugar transport system ATP-binding protein